MNILMVLMPLALALGLTGLAGFFWSMRTGQYSDMEGPGWRILDDDDLAVEPAEAEVLVNPPGAARS
ncbi:cbb3-type cytochrome oxidase assembly protein CcoS [Bosea sp. (in: a-proteobacteria)]|uniref:cbb3-type cytochrome oxidase assembly protein CcoS n=1 Tax=Bosea sp. (in: a-proteobacteria) TaxID=1871050 RepID=UPI002FC5D343